MTLALMDTTLLSNFAHVQRPDLLRAALGPSAAITPTIRAEILAGESLGLVPVCDWAWLQVVELTEREQELADELARQLDSGEAECLAVALSRNGWFLSDDFAARRIAEVRRAVVSGTLGVLARLIESGQLSIAEADRLLAEMIGRGYRSPVGSLRDLTAP